MHTLLTDPSETASFAGLRMDAADYAMLPDDGRKYELLDGVVIMSPSPTPTHQRVALEVAFQVNLHIRTNGLGVVLHETDVYLPRLTGPDIVYRPDVLYLRAERWPALRSQITAAPDVMVEVASPESRAYDAVTKKSDYEAAGVGEYWIIDPSHNQEHFHRLEQGKFAMVATQGDFFVSTAIPGFRLDLAALRACYR